MKCIHKYIYKGHDCTTMQIRNEQDKIKEYIDTQYIEALKVIWCLFGMKMHEEVLNVIQLILYLFRMHQVIFDPNNDVIEIIALRK